MKSPKRANAASRRILIAIIAAVLVMTTAVVGTSRVTLSDDQVSPQSFGVFNAVTAAQASLQGPSTGAHLGGNGVASTFSSLTRSRAMAIGDINGDGVPDVVIGAPDSTVSVTSGMMTDTRDAAGSVYVFFGGAGFGGTLDTNTANIKVLGAAGGDNTGFSVATGDVNGDGVDDLIIGAPGVSANNTDRTSTGAVYVIFGSHSLGVSTTIDLAAANSADVLILGIATGDAFGTSVAVGNAGGRPTDSAVDQAADDILAGAPGFQGPLPGRVGAGGAFLIFGGSRLNRTGGVTTVFDLTAALTAPDVEILGNAGDSLGSSVAMGTVTGGSSATLIVGAPAANRPVALSGPAVPALATTGAVYGVLGGQNLNTGDPLPKVFDIASEAQSLSVYGAASGDRAGYCVAAGDVNGDGTDDLIIGAPEAGTIPNSTARVGAGQAYVLIGGARLSQPGGDKRADTLLAFTTPNDAANLVSLTVLGAAGDQLGTTVSTGNFNAGTFSDTIPDLLIGAPGANSGAGEVSVIMGGPSLLAVNLRDDLLNQDDFRVTGSAGFNLGFAVAAADVNHDTASDLLVSAPFADVTGVPTRTEAGRVFMIAGTVPATSQNITVGVTAPVGGETLQVGQPFNITWTATDPNGNANLKRFQVLLSTDGGTNFNFVIANNLGGTIRNFSWTVPTGVKTTHGRIQVTAFDNLGATGHAESFADFVITDSGIPVTLLAPTGTENLKFGQMFTITWSVPTQFQAQLKGFDVFLSTDDGLTFPTKLVSGPDPSQPALGPATFSFDWTVPSICTTAARVAVTATSTTDVRTQAASLSSFAINDVGPTIDTTMMTVVTDLSRLKFLTTAPQQGSEVDFASNVLLEVSTGSSGTTFATFSKPPKVKASGHKLVTKGTINGQGVLDFFPDQATRFIRFTNPPCAVTLLKVKRNGTQLNIAP